MREPSSRPLAVRRLRSLSERRHIHIAQASQIFEVSVWYAIHAGHSNRRTVTMSSNGRCLLSPLFPSCASCWAVHTSGRYTLSAGLMVLLEDEARLLNPLAALSHISFLQVPPPHPNSSTVVIGVSNPVGMALSPEEIVDSMVHGSDNG